MQTGILWVPPWSEALRLLLGKIFWNRVLDVIKRYAKFWQNQMWRRFADSEIFWIRKCWGGVCFWGNRGWRENRTDIHPIGFRLLMGRRQRKQFYRRIRRPMKLLRAYLASIFLVWSSENGIKEKRRGLLQNFVDDVYVFQSRWCFGFVCDLAKWNESGKGEVPIYW